MSIVKVEHLQHAYLDKVLYADTNFQVNEHEHVGLIGQNGAGKSTLINILTQQTIPDAGTITWKKKVKIGYLDQYASLKPGQTIRDFLRSAFAPLLQQAQVLAQLYQQMSQKTDPQLLQRAGDIQMLLEQKGYYDIDTKVEQVATGLGLDALGYQRQVTTLSGGQRSKLILAKLLLQTPDILLLDEPTNYLDTQHIDWLAEYLQNFAGAFVVISHDFSFLKRIVNVVYDLELGQLTRYSGSLKQALRQKAANRRTYLKTYAAQQKKITKTQAYIQKNKAGSRSKSAKSREKQLAKMTVLAPPANRIKPNFSFPYITSNSQIILETNNLRIGYQQPLLQQELNFSLTMGEKLVITGFNGIGKTTLIKTILGLIPPILGDVQLAPTVKIGYYQQDLIWSQPLMVPLDILQQQFSDLGQRKLRQILAQTGLTSQQAASPIKSLSGGEQVKVKLAALMLTPANMLILDEPTNHLDDDSKYSLQQALKNYPGSVILVTHENSFYDFSWVDKVLNIETKYR
ncbi:ABC-F family ATP-binding cassette domain-containing protein [Bombilactobacillus bombi]|uniref:ABC-F family ATP-binding cassette domain-containing protein n=1 Tax=Bombilactobacillus bombi TaxID=1303590 RepID=UPI0015E606F6|nr:ABC-F family ATP-binding cassette domain-containing protein [Bombilactobacillus bombi]MBA1434493.1 ABC-F family ATP-binding cassette domain-containing protein [Bombilactobacillus bombi]